MLEKLLLLFRICPVVSSRWGVHLLMITLPLLLKDLPWVTDQVCTNFPHFWQCSGHFNDIRYSIGVSDGALGLSDCDDVPTEVETRSQCGRRRAVVTRRFVPLAGGASMPFPSSSHERSRELLEEAFDVGMYHIRCRFVMLQVLLLISCACYFRPFRE